MMKVPFMDLSSMHQEMQEELEAAYRRVIGSNCLILGPEVTAFEERFAHYCGVKHAIGVGNGWMPST